MTTEENKALVQHAYLDGMNTRDMSVIREVFAPSYVNYFPAGQGELHGIDEFVAALDEFIGSFSDLVFTVDDILGDGDKVALRWSAVGVHTGDYPGDPTNHRDSPHRPDDLLQCDRYLPGGDGQVIAEWNSLDGFDIVRQMTAP